MIMNIRGLYAAATISLMAAGAAAPAMAADTAVTCKAPVAFVITAAEGGLANYTINCSGGSSAGAITNFSYKVATNVTVAQLLQHSAGDHAIATNDGAITIYSNLSDTSGTAWGCSDENCRIIDQLVGY